MSDVALPDWEREYYRRYTPQGRDEPMEYVTYRHDGGDVRLRVAPAAIDGDDRPGYALTVTVYPDLDRSASTEIRHVLTVDRCVESAERFMSLFSAVYDGPGDIEAALEYAGRRVSDPDRALDLEIERTEDV